MHCIKSIFATLTLVCLMSVLYLLIYKNDYKTRLNLAKSVNVNDNTEMTTKTLAEKDSMEYDESEDPDTYEKFDLSLKDFPNFPRRFFETDVKTPAPYNKTCAKFPTLDTLIFNNLYWQTLRTSLGDYQLLGAYWDIRKKNKKAPTIRLLSMITPLGINEDLYCQFWFKNKVVLSKKVWDYLLWRKGWGGFKEGIYKPYMINCMVPEEYKEDPPIAVSLVKNPCEQATNIIKVNVNIPIEKEDFAVCVKGLDFHDDISIRLIEWIELLKLLGAQKIFFYELHIHEEIRKILDYYETEDGTVELTPVTLPGHYPNEPYLQHLFLSKYRTHKRLYELISYNDCFLKHMYEYKYIVLLDIDEVIMPSVGNWSSLMNGITSTKKYADKSSYNARNAYFFDDYLDEGNYFQDVPRYMHMLQHVYRIKDVMGSGLYIKSFHNTDSVLALHNHYPLYCVEPCKNMEIDPSKAKLQHYRNDCVKEVKSCDALKKGKVLDTSIWRFKAQLIENVESLIDNLEIPR